MALEFYALLGPFTLPSCKFRANTVRLDLAKFSHLGKSLQVFYQLLMVYFLFGKILSLLWQTCDSIGLILIVANDVILKNNLTIWSHVHL